MAKFSGMIGYVINVETKPGIWEEKVIERKYTGDLVKNWNAMPQTNTTTVNDNIRISSNISIMSDKFAFENLLWIRYVVFMGIKVAVTSVDPQYPRLILSLGGLYNA